MTCTGLSAEKPWYMSDKDSIEAQPPKARSPAKVNPSVKVFNKRNISINPVIYAEVAASFDSQEALAEFLRPLNVQNMAFSETASFLAGQAFWVYRQRKGAKSFGAGNFKALFEAIEREQELRGTL